MRITGIFSNYTKNLNFGAKNQQIKPKNLSKKPETDIFLKTPDRISRKYHKSGNIACESIYKDEKPYKDTWFDANGKAQWVRYFDGSFDLSRNPWHDWKKAPHIELTKTENGKTIRLYAEPAIEPKDGKKGKGGGFHLGITDKNSHSLRSSLYVNENGEFSDYNDENLPLLKDALEELLEIISSDEYKDDFGSSRQFNKGVKKAIKYIENKEKQA